MTWNCVCVAEFLEQPTADKQLAWIIPSVCVGTFLVAITVISAYKLYHNKGVRIGKPAPDAVHLMENGGMNGSHGSYTLEHLKLCSVVGEYNLLKCEFILLFQLQTEKSYILHAVCTVKHL